MYTWLVEQGEFGGISAYLSIKFTFYRWRSFSLAGWQYPLITPRVNAQLNILEAGCGVHII